MNDTNSKILYSPAIRDFCCRNGIVELQVFGSVLRNDFNESSDIDFLVSFDDNSVHTLFDIARMKIEFEALVGRPVDFVNKKALMNSKNFLRRDAILKDTAVIYAA